MYFGKIEKVTNADSVDLIGGHWNEAVLEFLLDSIVKSGENDESFHYIVEQL